MPKRIRNKLPSLSIVIPAYNEEKNIQLVLQDTLKYAPRYLTNYEVIVVNDGSTDKTGEIAQSFAKRNKSIRLIHKRNGGFGRAMLTGIKAAKKEFIAYMPADGQFLIQDMQYCLPLMKSADLILGARGSRSDYTTYRLILSFGFLILLRMLYGLTFQDVNWLNIWRAKKVKNLKVSSRGVFILAEIIIRFQRNGLIVVEAPSFYRTRRAGEIKNAKISVATQTFIDTMKFWLFLHIKKAFLNKKRKILK